MKDQPPLSAPGAKPNTNTSAGSNTNTTPRVLPFSPQSLARRRAEYRTVLAALRASLDSPRARATDRRVIRQVLAAHPDPDRTGPRSIGLRLYADQWPAVSRALRDWQDTGALPRAAQIAYRAWRRTRLQTL